MSSRGWRSSEKRKSSDMDGSASNTEPSKRVKTNDMASNNSQQPNIGAKRSGQPNTAQAKKSTNSSNGEISKYFAKKSATSKPNSSSTASKSSAANISQPQKAAAAQSKSPESTESNEGNVLRLRIRETIGNIFHTPHPNSLLIHACNTEGSWGAGIAAAFKKHYPGAFEVYNTHCRLNGGDLLSTALLIPPQPGDSGNVFVGCLFTSRSKGRKKDPPGKILQATGPAMQDLMRQVRAVKGQGKGVREVKMCKINSGLFNVKWEKTRAVLEGIEVGEDDFKEVVVVEREE